MYTYLTFLDAEKYILHKGVIKDREKNKLYERLTVLFNMRFAYYTMTCESKVFSSDLKHGFRPNLDKNSKKRKTNYFDFL